MSGKTSLSGKDPFLTCSEDMFEGFIRERLNSSTEEDAEDADMDTEQPIANYVSEVIAGEESPGDNAAGINDTSDQGEGKCADKGESSSDNTSNKGSASTAKSIIVSREKLNLKSYFNRKVGENVILKKSINVVKQSPVPKVISPKHDNRSTMLSPNKAASGVFLVKSPVDRCPLNSKEMFSNSGKKVLIVSQKNLIANGDESRRKRRESESSPEKDNNTSIPIKKQKCIVVNKSLSVTQGAERKSLDVSGISSLVEGSYNGHVSEKMEVSVGASSVDSKVNTEASKNKEKTVYVPNERELANAPKLKVASPIETSAFNFKKPIQLNGNKTIVTGTGTRKPISIDSATHKKLMTLMKSSDDKIFYVKNNTGTIRFEPISEHSVKCVVEKSNEHLKEQMAKNASKAQKIIVQGDCQETDNADLNAKEKLHNSKQQHFPSNPTSVGQSSQQSKRISEKSTDTSEMDISSRQTSALFDSEKELSEMYLRQLTDRTVPIFEPPPTEPFVVNMLGCAECQDKFTQQSSLDFHRSRRSVLISYWCNMCKRRLSFFNRCALMRHLRGHQQRLSTLDMSCVSINPIPNNLIKFGNTYDQSPQNVQHQIIKKVLVPAQDSVVKNTSTTSSKRSTDSTQTNSNSVSTNVTPDSVMNKKIEPQTRKLRVDIVGKKQLVTSTVEDVVPAVKEKLVPVAVEEVVPNNNSPNVDVRNATELKRVLESIEIETSSPSTLSTTPPKNHNNKDPKVVKFKAIKRIKSCPECKVNLGSDKTLQDHLLNTNKPSNPFLRCNDCQLILPSRCSLRMHLRMHIPIKPYRCPECGIEYQIYERFIMHLKFECCHLAKVIKFMCTLCNLPEPSLTRLRVHVLDFHTRRIFKCNNCSMAFLNRKLMLRHHSEVHPITTANFTLFSQCRFCPDKMIPQKKFANHVAKHITDENYNLYMYECYQCKVCFLQNKDLAEHLKTCVIDSNGNKVVAKSSTGDSGTVSRPPDLAGGVSERNYVEVEDEAPRAEILVQMEDEIELIVPERRSATLEEDEVCEQDPLSLEGFQVEEPPVSEPMVELCVLCKKQQVVIEPGESAAQQSLCCRDCVRPCSETDLQPRQMTMTTRRKPKTQTIYRCKLCNYLSVVGFDVVLRHFRRVHKEVGDGDVKHFVAIETKNVFHSVRSKTVSTAESIKDKYLKKRKVNDSGASSFKVKEEQMEADEDDDNDNCDNESLGEVNNGRILKKRSPPKAKPNSAATPLNQFDRGLVIEVSQPADNNLKCSKCNFVAESMSDLREHVPQHRTEPNAMQCLDCGECFVVMPSLEKHLAIRHHILDAAKYIADNPSCVPPDSTTNNVDTFKCSVCLTSFDSRHALDKHIRIHGMAFLKQTRPIS